MTEWSNQTTRLIKTVIYTAQKKCNTSLIWQLCVLSWAAIMFCLYNSLRKSRSKATIDPHAFLRPPSVRSSVRISVTLSSPKPLGGILPNLLRHVPSLLGCARGTLFFHASVQFQRVGNNNLTDLPSLSTPSQPPMTWNWIPLKSLPQCSFCF